MKVNWFVLAVLLVFAAACGNRPSCRSLCKESRACGESDASLRDCIYYCREDRREAEGEGCLEEHLDLESCRDECSDEHPKDQCPEEYEAYLDCP